MMERKCDTCIHRKENGCEKWECEYEERADERISRKAGRMRDLISRQAAIDAIVNTVSKIGLHDNSEVARYGATFRQHETIDIIKGLPSAEPEVIRCKDCENWDASWSIDLEPNTHYCPIIDKRREGNWYCADAERRTDENPDLS